MLFETTTWPIVQSAPQDIYFSARTLLKIYLLCGFGSARCSLPHKAQQLLIFLNNLGYLDQYLPQRPILPLHFFRFLFYLNAHIGIIKLPLNISNKKHQRPRFSILYLFFFKNKIQFIRKMTKLIIQLFILILNYTILLSQLR